METEREILKIAIPVLDMVTTNYENALQESGAQPIVIKEVCDPLAYDGLLLPGGDDVDPARFGQELNGSLGISRELDALQFEVLDRFVKAGKPVLGICRGHQVINIYFGGDLIQDLGEKNECHRRTGDQDKVHRSITKPGTWLEELYGTEYPTNSAHHQAVGAVGTGLKTVSLSEDGVIEALVHESLPIYSTQWHPERMCFANRREDTVDGSRVIRFFLDVCRKKAE